MQKTGSKIHHPDGGVPLNKRWIFLNRRGNLTRQPPNRFAFKSSNWLTTGQVPWFCSLREEHDESEGEFEGIYGSEYEGRRGASPREMITMIALAAEDKSRRCLSPLSMLDELSAFIKESSVHDFLRIPVDNGYHDSPSFIEQVRESSIEDKDRIEHLLDRSGIWPTLWQ